MRVRSARTAVLSLIAPIVGALALAGCSQRTEVTETYAPPPPPPPARSEPVLMGAPHPTAQSQVDARAAERQAHDDAWLANLPEGVIAHREVDPRTGRVVWIISNRPIPNPTQAHVFYRWTGGLGESRGHRPHLNGEPRHAHHYGLAPGAVTVTPAAPAPEAKVAPVAPAPKVAASTPAAKPVAPTPPEAAVAPKAPFTMSPMLWLVAGIVLLILVLLILLGGRKGKRRSGAAHAH
jgi:hypothetical protein